MALGDILSAVVRADGWSMDVTIEGFAVGAVYDFGSLGLSPATIATPKLTVTVVSEGYNASGVLGTVTRTVYGTKVVRKPYPDTAVNDESVALGNLVVRVALSASIYNDDKNGGAGTSGVNPVVTIAAGWATNAGGAGQPSHAATSLPCTNNSTADYPKVIGQWDAYTTPLWMRCEADFALGFMAVHGHGVAAVALSATGATSSNVVSGIATTATRRVPTASQLSYESYNLAVPIAGFTQGEAITLKAVAYPIVGDENSVIDTSANTVATDRIRGLTEVTCQCDKTGALKIYGVVSSGGSDTTGATSAVLVTAASAPYATIGKALAAGATVIYLRSGTLDILGSTPVSVTALGYYREVRPYPGETVTLDRSGSWKAFKASKLAYIGIQSITCSVVGGNLDGNGGFILQFRDCGFSTTTKPTVGIGYRSDATWFVNCTGMGGDHYTDYSTSRFAYNFTGCAFSSPPTIQPVYAMVACSLSGQLVANSVRIYEKSASTGNPAPTQNNLIVMNNKITAVNVNANGLVKFGVNSDLSGVAFIGNVMEVAVITASSAAFWVGGDGGLTALDNVIIGNNTVVGERTNLFYNDSGSVANVRTNCFVRNNAFRSVNIKSDNFALQPDGNRVGNWPQIYGVNWSDNRYDGAESDQFVQAHMGINCAYVNAPDSVHGQLGFTTDNSSDGTGTGGGDYKPTAASVLTGHTLVRTEEAWDLVGVVMNGCIGAYQRQNGSFMAGRARGRGRWRMRAAA